MLIKVGGLILFVAIFQQGGLSGYMDLTRLCPCVLECLFQTSTYCDDLILLGGGYYYPDLFSQCRPNPVEILRSHVN